jgi:hypothetical protein
MDLNNAKKLNLDAAPERAAISYFKTSELAHNITLSTCVHYFALFDFGFQCQEIAAG